MDSQVLEVPVYFWRKADAQKQLECIRLSIQFWALLCDTELEGASRRERP